MKKLLFLLVFLPVMAFSQQPLVFYKVVKTDSTLNAASLYSMALAWTAMYYANSKFVIQLKDDQTHQIIGKASMIYNPKNYRYFEAIKGHFDYTFIITCKDGRFKYEIGPFFHVPDIKNQVGNICFGTITTDSVVPNINTNGFWFMTKKWKQDTWNDMRNQIDNYVLQLTIDLKKNMMNKKPENNW